MAGYTARLEGPLDAFLNELEALVDVAQVLERTRRPTEIKIV
jgi:hypothetical protein